MPLMSGGRLVLADATPQADVAYYHPTSGLNLTAMFANYGAIYKKQKWVYTVVRKRALATRRLPLKVYLRSDNGRDEDRAHPLAALLRRPNPRHSGAFLWEWTSSTFDIFGEAIWLKIRDRDGIPAELWPVHPSNVVIRKDGTRLEYVYGVGITRGADPQFVIPERDVVHFKSYNPDDTVRGLSPLEPLRLTLVNEDAARRASSAFWSNGARPSGYLAHPGNLSKPAADRLRDQWNAIHGGVDNFGKWAILEEGMKPEVLSLTAEESQYIESRRLNREEVCAAYDMPPPAVHILDRATFSNITEQFRSVYRDTMAPHLSGFEGTLEFDLVPDFGADDVYPEFLMDEVLRGDFEQRVDSYQKGINSGWLMPAEARQLENLPFVEGSDRLYVNSTLVPIDKDDDVESRLKAAESIGLAAQRLGLATQYGLLTAEEARPVIGLDGPGPPPAAPLPPPQDQSLDALWGRLGSYQTVDEIEPGVLTAGLNGHTDLVRSLLDAAITDGDTITEFRARVRAALDKGATP